MTDTIQQIADDMKSCIKLSRGADAARLLKFYERLCRECERQYNKRRNAMVGEQRRLRREAKKMAAMGRGS